LTPDQPPEAVQEVALVDDQFKVEPLPVTTLLGLAVKCTVGAGEVTDTVVDCVALLPLPVQVSPKVVSLVSAPVVCEPLMALLPDQPPEAVQEVALLADQVSVDAPPDSSVLRLA
jgi:hypothetical protein